MTHRLWALLLIACLLFAPVRALATDHQLSVFIDGRRVDEKTKSGLLHDDVAYINAVRAVRTFDGLMTFGKHDKRLRITIAGRTIAFVVGSRNAQLDGMPITLAGAPFQLHGDIYLPLRTVARLGGARYTVDTHQYRAALSLGSGEGFPAPQPTAVPSGTDDVQPSPAQALSFVTTQTSDATGLHASVTIKNMTAKPYTLMFPSAKQVAFVVSQNGSEVWNSTATVTGDAPTSLTLDPLGSKIVTADWPDYAKLGPGRYSLRVRLMTLIPIDAAPISLGIQTGSPAPSH